MDSFDSPIEGNVAFSEAQLMNIMNDEKLSEIALRDPKRAKRILANRQRVRKLQYIAELEHKVRTLEKQVATLSALRKKRQTDESQMLENVEHHQMTNYDDLISFMLELDDIIQVEAYQLGHGPTVAGI